MQERGHRTIRDYIRSRKRANAQTVSRDWAVKGLKHLEEVVRDGKRALRKEGGRW